MALVDIHTGKSRKRSVEFIVVGEDDKGCKAGDIRWAWWSRFHSSPILKVDWNAERTRALEVRIDQEFKRKGWRLLRDMYAEDPERAHFWADFQAFAEAQQTNPVGMKGRQFPEDRLPRKLQEMRAATRKAELEAEAFVFPTDGASIDGNPQTELDASREQLGLDPVDAPKDEPAKETRGGKRSRGA